MWIRECGSNEKGENQKKKRSSVQKFPQTLVFISKFLRFSTNPKVKTKKEVFSSKMSTNFCSHLAIFHKFLSEDQKKRSSSPTFHEIRCESTKTTKKQFLLANSRTISTSLGVLGLDLHSSSPEHVNFFVVQFSLGGGARPRNAPSWRWAALMGTKGWFQRSGSSSFELLLAEGDSVERSDRNVLQGTFCFQVSTAFPFYCYIPFTEVESSRTHFEVLGLKASSSQKLPSSARGQQYFWNP